MVYKLCCRLLLSRHARIGWRRRELCSACRDVKLENLLVRRHDPDPVDGRKSVQGMHVRLIDFGSALDAHSVSSLYGEQGPSAEEQTMEYAPPEALLGRSAACLPAHALLQTQCTL